MATPQKYIVASKVFASPLFLNHGVACALSFEVNDHSNFKHDGGIGLDPNKATWICEMKSKQGNAPQNGSVKLTKFVQKQPEQSISCLLSKTAGSSMFQPNEDAKKLKLQKEAKELLAEIKELENEETKLKRLKADEETELTRIREDYQKQKTTSELYRSRSEELLRVLRKFLKEKINTSKAKYEKELANLNKSR